MGMESTSMVRLLKSMENKGLICRKTDSLDKRKVIICLTDLGKEKRELAKEVVVKLNNELQQQLSEKEIENFKKTMMKINHHLNQLEQTKC
jgi:DNA-binding MarR family transcriptional regulator